MALTYRPFAEVPQVQELGRELHMNLPDRERNLSTIIGATLIGVGAGQSGIARWAFFAFGAGLLRRGWTGQCPWYRYLGVDRRHPARDQLLMAQ